MSKIHCISYASNDFLNRTKGYTNEIENFNRFDSYKIYSEQDLNSDFTGKFKNVLNLSRGGGYWVWKPQIIKQHLDTLNDGDILFYTDVGCTFNCAKESNLMFDKYLDIINQTSFLRFATTHKELEFTNKNTISFFADKYNQNFNKIANSRQLIASIMAYRKNETTNNFFKEYLKCIEEDQFLITDAYNDIDRDIKFKDHRHDQSLFSILYKSLGYNSALEDHTWSSDFNTCLTIPILTTRSRI